jgi:hypothetical protein
MKKLIWLLVIILVNSGFSLAQKSETFDIATFTIPKGWQKEVKENAVQLGADDSKGGICLVTLFKSVPSSKDSKTNFNSSWETTVKGVVTVNSKPQMNESVEENGWIAQSGIAPYESDGKKGVVMLVTLTGNQKLINILILTNTQDFQEPVTKFLESIILPKITAKNPSVSNQEDTKTVPARSSNFKFSTTNFDDGWISTEREDWVEVVKGNIKVLIHYPKEGTIFPADPEPLTNAAWNILVAPRYSNLKNYKTSYINTYNRPYLGMGYATDNTTGKQVFVLLLRQGDSGWIEFITPDKNSFIQQYKFDPEAIRWDSESELLKPLTQMVNYNKFAVAESDFTGTWTSDFTGVQQMYNVYTGSYAGMNINQSSQEFVFGAGNTYSWKLLVVNGMVGNTKYANVKSEGKFSVLNNWQVHFSKIESGAKTYNAHWSCIKGARLLKLLDANAPGSGIYTVFGKK